MKKPIRSLLATIWSDLRTISKTVTTLQSHVENKLHDYAITFAIELFATLLGVSIALYGTRYFEQRALNTATTQRLELAVFVESQDNRPLLTAIFQDFSEDSQIIRMEQPDISMATAALSDPNIASLPFPLFKMSLLILYIDTHLKLNHALNLYQDYTLAASLANPKNPEASSNNQRGLSKIIRRTAALAAITSDYLQDLLPLQSRKYPYDPNDPYDHLIIQSLKQEIDTTLTKLISETILIDSWLGP